MAVKPLSPKGLLNANLMLMLPTLTRRSDGPPGGHANLGRGLPRLKENSLEGVLAVKVIATSLRPEVVNQEAPEDVEGLAAVSEAARVIAVEVRGSSSSSKMASPRRMKGQVMWRRLGALHSFQTL